LLFEVSLPSTGSLRLLRLPEPCNGVEHARYPNVGYRSALPAKRSQNFL
jgi:hypothetical protein